MSRALTARREAVLREQFPGWRVREVTGQWIAARKGGPVVVRASAVELRDALRWIDQASPDPAGGDPAKVEGS
ncbi:hypothetical protein [Thermomonospora echinospora]|uniref:hypothetical protein n=1 Tax=Thermomonospora echinospora TaxID=1992 RepID=UPI0011B06FC9|nr:hypothetical protein [Thermomonospora echinospora]